MDEDEEDIYDAVAQYRKDHERSTAQIHEDSHLPIERLFRRVKFLEKALLDLTHEMLVYGVSESYGNVEIHRLIAKISTIKEIRDKLKGES